MLIEILKRTPLWVFALFLVLATVGYFQSRDRNVGRAKVTILPLAMIALSFYGVISAFGMNPGAVIYWAVGFAAMVWLGAILALPRGISYTAETQTFFVPGSWLPLALMMAIFFTKYTVGVILARRLAIADEPIFISIISLCYGLFSGIFFSRALVILRTSAPSAYRIKTDTL